METNDYIMKNLAGDPNLESHFKHIVCGDAAVDEANQRLVQNNILNTREKKFLAEHDEYCDGTHDHE